MYRFLPLCPIIGRLLNISFVIGIAKSWRLGLVLSSAILLIIGICIPWVMLADKWYVELLDQYAQAGSLAEEIIGSVRTIKAFASETILGDRFDQLMKRARRKGQLAAGSDGIGFPLISQSLGPDAKSNILPS